ncbi:hypothetical protein, partial [Acinetobacter junii]
IFTFKKLLPILVSIISLPIYAETYYCLYKNQEKNEDNRKNLRFLLISTDNQNCHLKKQLKDNVIKNGQEYQRFSSNFELQKQTGAAITHDNRLYWSTYSMERLNHYSNYDDNTTIRYRSILIDNNGDTQYIGEEYNLTLRLFPISSGNMIMLEYDARFSNIDKEYTPEFKRKYVFWKKISESEAIHLNAKDYL